MLLFVRTGPCDCNGIRLFCAFCDRKAFFAHFISCRLNSVLYFISFFSCSILILLLCAAVVVVFKLSVFIRFLFSCPVRRCRAANARCFGANFYLNESEANLSTLFASFLPTCFLSDKI